MWSASIFFPARIESRLFNMRTMQRVVFLVGLVSLLAISISFASRHAENSLAARTTGDVHAANPMLGRVDWAREKAELETRVRKSKRKAKRVPRTKQARRKRQRIEFEEEHDKGQEQDEE